MYIAKHLIISDSKEYHEGNVVPKKIALEAMEVNPDCISCEEGKHMDGLPEDKKKQTPQKPDTGEQGADAGEQGAKAGT